ncbi:MAG TPA: 30S ribosomal protein S8e [Candidatus Nanoarchaeia archaeon]|nr:30S ribosomal protein S8e [Candidatus Nanoarchaeia archaeon]
MITQARSRRKPSGGRYHSFRDKRLHERASHPTLTKLSERSVRTIRLRGGSIKARLLTTNMANVYNGKTKKFMQSKIVTISDNPANRNYVRRNIITKGTIIDTEAGKARVTNRPGQEGAVNAVLLSE